jgi:O-acetyl-ADP-ribose deacetylase
MDIVIVRGDITAQDTDAIVNAANEQMRPGGGVDGAITRAAGPEALADRERLRLGSGVPPLPTGSARAGAGGELAARWIIYTAGPIYSGAPRDAELLRRCHESSMRVADEVGARSVAFPAISCGVYGYPVDEAAPIAVDAVMGAGPAVELVRFVLCDERTEKTFRRALASGRGEGRW